MKKCLNSFYFVKTVFFFRVETSAGLGNRHSDQGNTKLTEFAWVFCTVQTSLKYYFFQTLWGKVNVILFSAIAQLILFIEGTDQQDFRPPFL